LIPSAEARGPASRCKARTLIENAAFVNCRDAAAPEPIRHISYLEPVAEKLIDFSDRNKLQLFDFEPLLLARVIQPMRKML
jgi:hypothetical protein